MSTIAVTALTEVAKNLKEKTSENIKSAFSDLKSIADKGTLTELSTALNLASIAAPGLKILFGELNAETMPARIASMTALIDLIESPAGTAALNSIGDFLGTLIGYLPDILGFITTLVNALEKSGSLDLLLASFQGTLILIGELVTGIGDVADKIDRLISNLSSLEEKLQILMDFINRFSGSNLIPGL
jgi:hypothetical protein